MPDSSVGNSVGVSVSVGAQVGISVGVSVGVGVLDGVAVEVAVDVAVTVLVAVAVLIRVAVAEGRLVAVGAGRNGSHLGAQPCSSTPPALTPAIFRKSLRDIMVLNSILLDFVGDYDSIAFQSPPPLQAYSARLPSRVGNSGQVASGTASSAHSKHV
jgi:hypothetical protein